MDVLDMTIAKNIARQISVETINALKSDHLLIKVILMGMASNAVETNTLKYEGANWQKFREEIEKNI